MLFHQGLRFSIRLAALTIRGVEGREIGSGGRDGRKEEAGEEERSGRVKRKAGWVDGRRKRHGRRRRQRWAEGEAGEEERSGRVKRKPGLVDGRRKRWVDGRKQKRVDGRMGGWEEAEMASWEEVEKGRWEGGRDG